MSDKKLPLDSDNPFLAIDKSQFARARGPRGQSGKTGLGRWRGGNQTADLKRTGKAARNPQSGEDAAAESEYFSQLMNLGGVEKLSETVKVNPTEARDSVQSVNVSSSSGRPEHIPEVSVECPPEWPSEYPSEDSSEGVREYFTEPQPEPRKSAHSSQIPAAESLNNSAPGTPPPAGQIVFGGMADQLAGFKLKADPGPEPSGDARQGRGQERDREQEDQMLKEYLASAPMRQTVPEKSEKPGKVAPKTPPARRNAAAPKMVPQAAPKTAPQADFQGAIQIDGAEDEFSLAMREVAPLSGKGRAVAPEPEPPNQQIAPSNPLRDFIDGKVEFSLEFTEEFIEGHVVGLDPAIMGKLRAGSFSCEAHLDLHGLNSVQAFDNLVAFIRKSYMGGKRAILVIPGRGKNSPDGTGVLRDKLQEWLTQEPFKRVVLAFATALPRHGGPGAVYVLLRKYKKSSGKIRWDVIPNDPDLFV